jgi:2-polyprenyl-3-methyl-5-hydroxy-6-metoxy-1,4-benzoquinol methylase
MANDIGYYSAQRPELVALISDATKVLDVGCGSGAMAAKIKNDCSPEEVWGVEVVEEVGLLAKANPALNKVLIGSIEDLSDQIPDATFSHIVAGDVIEHLIDPWKTVAELKRKLKPDGVLICSLPNIRNFSFFLKLFIVGKFEYKDSGVMDRTHLRFFARKDARALFENAGFTDVSIDTFEHKKTLVKRLGRLIFGDLLTKRLLIIARN